MSTLLDSYSSTNADTTSSESATGTGRGQSFTVPANNYKLNTIKMYVRNGSSGNGTATARLYTHSGTYGTSSVPAEAIGSPVATSSVVTIDQTSLTMVEFTFDGTYTLNASTYYCIAVYVESGYVRWGYDASSPSHGGNYFSGGTWAANSGRDIAFEVYGTLESSNITVDVPLIEVSSSTAQVPTVATKLTSVLAEATGTAQNPNLSLSVPTPVATITGTALTPEVNYYIPPIPVIITPITRNIFQGNRYEYFTYELLMLYGGQYIHNGFKSEYVDKASINIDFTRDIIGSASFNINRYAWVNYYSDLFRPWYNMVIDGVTYSYPLGTYMLATPTEVSDGKVLTKNVQAYDLLLALEQDKVSSSYLISSGTNVITAIETLLDSVGTWVLYSLEPSTQVLANDVSYEIGKSKLFIINSLLNMINYYPLWCNGLGIYRAVPWSEYSNVTWEFEDNTNSLYKSGISVKFDYATVYNKVIIVANQLTADTAPLISTRTFEDEGMSGHPLSYTSLGRYITKRFESDAVSQTYVDLRARRELLKMVEVEESINYKHAFVTAKEDDGLPNQGDCYNFKNSLLDLNSTYKIVSQSWDLHVGSMVNSTIRRLTSEY